MNTIHKGGKYPECDARKENLDCGQVKQPISCAELLDTRSCPFLLAWVMPEGDDLDEN